MKPVKQLPNESTTDRRSEKAGIFNFVKEMSSALIMAFIAIVYVIQAFKIPSGSMENSLLTGDFLLGLKFIYGAPVLPFTYLKFPGIQKPNPGDVIIFKYPGSDNKDYIKRCVAGPGQTIEIHTDTVIINGANCKIPPRGKYIMNGNLNNEEIREFSKLYIPKKGDTLYPETMPIREFLFCKHLIHQEHPDKSIASRLQNVPVLNKLFKDNPDNTAVKMRFLVYIDSTYRFDAAISTHVDNWINLSSNLNNTQQQLQNKYPQAKIEIRPVILLNDKRITSYIVKHNNYFMMGDNRDNSLDSRYWGYLNKNFIRAKAFILYFSWATYYENPSNNEPKLIPLQVRYRNGTVIHNTDNPEQLTEVLQTLEYHHIGIWWNEKGELIQGVPKQIPSFLFPLKIRWNRIGKLIKSWDGTIQN